MWNLNDAISKNPNNDAYVQTKTEILDKMHTFIKEYIDLTINPETFKDLYDQKIKELDDLIEELNPKTDKKVKIKK